MRHALNTLFAPAAMERLTLVVNHVLAGEPVATERLAHHAGRTIDLEWHGWPRLLPAPPAYAFRVTRAGLLEWCGIDGVSQPDLRLRLDASNPALLLMRTLAGEMPAVEIEGDAALASDASWLIENVRWDVAADLERLFGPTVGHQVHRLGSALARGLRVAVQGAGSLADRLRPRAP